MEILNKKVNIMLQHSTKTPTFLMGMELSWDFCHLQLPSGQRELGEGFLTSSSRCSPRWRPVQVTGTSNLPQASIGRNGSQCYAGESCTVMPNCDSSKEHSREKILPLLAMKRSWVWHKCILLWDNIFFFLSLFYFFFSCFVLFLTEISGLKWLYL